MEEKRALHHWNYFLNLEKDLYNTSRIVEFDSDNFNVFSIEFSKLLLSTGAEIDVLCKLLSEKADPDKLLCNLNKGPNIQEYNRRILSEYPKFKSASVKIVKLDLTIKPFDSWSEDMSPQWWRDHNKVKHSRHLNYKKANLKNCLYSMAALLLLNLYYYRIVLGTDYATPPGDTLIYTCEYYAVNLLCRHEIELPDFTNET